MHELATKKELTMKNILLAISGLTPQIVTEMLYALSIQKGIKIDEIYIITTKRGLEVLQGKDKDEKTPVTPLRKEINELCTTYGIKKPKFNIKKNVIVAEMESLKLYDIKTDKENKLFPNKLAEVLKTLTADENNIIHASLSGGRKSMSAHLALVMSLFARSQDKLYHVLTDEKYEFKNFYPKDNEEERALVVAEIPFVRLRCINDPLLKEDISYSDLVEKTQKKLRYLTENAKLVVELKKQLVRYKDKAVKLTPMEIGLYTTFVQEKINTGGGIEKYKLIYSKKFAKELEQFLSENFNMVFDKTGNKSESNKHWTEEGIEEKYFLSLKSKINGKIKNLFDDMELAEEFMISTKGGYGYADYYIKAPKNKLGINYE